MANKYFNVKTGIKTGNVTLDAATGNVSVSNLLSTGVVSAVNLYVSGNLTSNLTPNANGVLSLGASTQRFDKVFVANTVDIAGQTITANATSVSISGNLVVASANISTLDTATFTATTANVQNLTANTANVYSIKVLAELEGNVGRFDILTANTGNFANLNSNVANVNTLSINNQLAINSSTNSTSTTTGSFVTAGGVGIQKDLYVGGTIHLANGAGGTTSKGSINYNDGVSSIDFKFNG